MPAVEEKIDRIEQAIDNFVRNADMKFTEGLQNLRRCNAEEIQDLRKDHEEKIKRSNERIARTEERIARLDEEIRDLQKQNEENRRRMDEEKASAEKSREEDHIKWKQEIAEKDERDKKKREEDHIKWKQEMAEKDECDKKKREEDKIEWKQLKKEMNISWGEMAKKMGTITKDLAAPSIPRIIKEKFGFERDVLAINIEKRLPDGRVKEYDLIMVAGDYVFVDSTKSTLRVNDVVAFVEDIKQVRVFYPEYQDKKIIGILASLSVKENVLKFAERTGFMVIAVGEELMEVQNSKDFQPKIW